MICECNFDGLVGPTHNYAGLSYGNVASEKNRHVVANPRAAALQGLDKMQFVGQLGIPQGFLPPVYRPVVDFLKQLGFRGTRAGIIDQAFRQDPVLLACAYSASSMWTANAATVSSSGATYDGKVHISVANLSSGLHRSTEASGTEKILRLVFPSHDHFNVHAPLPASVALADEGAANHTRLVIDGDDDHPREFDLFVFGRNALDARQPAPQRFPARQTLQASQAIARRHGLADERTLFWQQNPAAIDAGVFHNDVISVGHQNVLLLHELAFCDQPNQLEQLRQMAAASGGPIWFGSASNSQISLEQCVASYLFNSQLLSRPNGKMILLCPLEVEEIEPAKQLTARWIEEIDPLDEVNFLDLRQSMRNGGGPACLRLRVPLDAAQQSAVHPAFWIDDPKIVALQNWVERHYRTELVADDLRDPQLLDEIDNAFADLESVLQLPPGSLRPAEAEAN